MKNLCLETKIAVAAYVWQLEPNWDCQTVRRMVSISKQLSFAKFVDAVQRVDFAKMEKKEPVYFSMVRILARAAVAIEHGQLCVAAAKREQRRAREHFENVRKITRGEA